MVTHYRKITATTTTAAAAIGAIHILYNAQRVGAGKCFILVPYTGHDALCPKLYNRLHWIFWGTGTSSSGAKIAVRQ